MLSNGETLECRGGSFHLYFSDSRFTVLIARRYDELISVMWC